jgi:MarR family transcriptional regulator, 2-MHQ and catechol-resistance regulon repressor
VGTKFKGPAREVRALDAYIALVRAAESTVGRAATHLAQEGLTVSQFGVLDALYHLGPMHQSAVARRILKTNGNLTLVVDNLEKRSLVRRRRDSDDRRCVTVSLTDQGRTLVEKVLPAHATKIADLFQSLSSQEQKTLKTLCRRLGLHAAGES